MKISLTIVRTLACMAFLFIVSGIPADGQDKDKSESKFKDNGFCSNQNYSSDGKSSFNEIREMTLPATGELNVDGGQNGGIRVKGENRSDILVRACVQTWGTSEENAKANAGSIKISTSGQIKAEGGEDSRWSVSYEITAPRSTNVNLSARNGGISLDGIDGKLEFETVNGGVSLRDVAGEVRGRTTNGGVNVVLSGNSWKGGGLDVTTSNGGVHISMPENYAANIETGTVNGGFNSDIPALNVTTEDVKGDRSRSRRINTPINGGGPTIRVVTTNGGVKISSGDGQSKH